MISPKYNNSAVSCSRQVLGNTGSKYWFGLVMFCANKDNSASQISPKISVFQRNATLERTSTAIELLFRNFLSFYNTWGKEAEIEKVHKQLSRILPQSLDFIKSWILFGRAQGRHKEIEINLETGLLDKIAQSKEPMIFIMNHEYMREDPVFLSLFLSMLYDRYWLYGEAEQAPRPKIILNKDILDSVGNDKLRELMEKFGCVGIDASIHKTPEGEKYNATAMRSLVGDFAKGNSHIFVFPEGRLAWNKNVPLQERLQPGFANLIQLALRKRGQVTIVPLGFAHNKRVKQKVEDTFLMKFKPTDGEVKTIKATKTLGSIFMGEPIRLTRDEHKAIVATQPFSKDMKQSSIIPDILPFLSQHLVEARQNALDTLPTSFLSETLKI